MSSNPNLSIRALADFHTAACELRDAWSERLDDGYPSELPSFDEFVTHISEWYEQVVSNTVIDNTTPNWPFILTALRLGYAVELYGTNKTGEYVKFRTGYYLR